MPRRRRTTKSTAGSLASAPACSASDIITGQDDRNNTNYFIRINPTPQDVDQKSSNNRKVEAKHDTSNKYIHAYLNASALGGEESRSGVATREALDN